MSKPNLAAARAEPHEEEVPRGRARHRSARLTSILGVTFAILFTVGLYLMSMTPRPDATDAEVRAYYAAGDARYLLISGLYLIPFSAVAFLWFLAALRQWAEQSRRTIDQLLSTVQLLSGVSFITLALAEAAAATVVAAEVTLAQTPLDLVAARQFPQFGRALLVIFGMRMAAIFVMTTVNIGRQAQLYPRWFVIGSVVVAVALFLAASLDPWLVTVFPVWVLVLSGLIWVHAARPSPEPPEAGAAPG